MQNITLLQDLIYRNIKQIKMNITTKMVLVYIKKVRGVWFTKISSK